MKERVAQMAHMATAPASCDLTWVGTTSGDWSDATRWSPSVTPDMWDSVCFGAGTYSVNLPSTAGTEPFADQVRFLPGSVVTMDGTAACTAPVGIILHSNTFWVEPGASTNVRGCVQVTAATVTRIDGTLSLDASNFHAGALLIFGVLELIDQYVGTITSGPVSVASTGELRLTGANYLAANSLVGLSGGTVTGTGQLRVVGSAGSSLQWTGGTFPARQASGSASVIFNGASIVLGAAGRGALDIESEEETVTQVSGHISATQDVALMPPCCYDQGGTVFLEPPAGSAPGAPALLMGTLAVRNVVLESTSPIRNSGTLLFGKAVGNGGLSVNHMRGTTFDNTGQVTALDSTRIEQMTVSNTGVLRTIGSAGNLVMVGGRYAVNPAGSHVGRLSLESTAQLAGNGSLDHVVSVGGVVSPGAPTALLGSLTFATLTLDPASRVEVDIGGLTSMDRLVATNLLALGGTMDVRRLAPFVGGLCGQIVTPISATRTATRTGGFTQYVGTSLTTTSRWRPYLSTTAVSLVGHDPSRILGLSSTAVQVSEAGNVANTQLCFSGVGPTSNVTVMATARFGQSTASPSPLLVTPGNWALPHTLTAQGIDDAVAEPLHVDSIQFRMTSTDAFYNGPVQQQLAVAITDNDPGVDLGVEMVSLNNPVTAQQTMERRFRITNSGGGASTGSTFSIPAPVGVTFLANGVGANCAMSGPDLQCAVGPLAAGSQYEFVVLFTAPAAAGSYDNTFGIRGNEYDPANGNNKVLWILTVN